MIEVYQRPNFSESHPSLWQGSGPLECQNFWWGQGYVVFIYALPPPLPPLIGLRLINLEKYGGGLKRSGGPMRC